MFKCFHYIHFVKISMLPSRLYLLCQNSFHTCSFLWFCADIPAGFPDVRCPCSFKAMKSYPQRDSVHRSLTEGSGREQRNANQSGREESLTEINSATTDDQPVRKRRWRKCQTKDEFIAGACCGEVGHSWLTYVQHPHPCLVKLISFLHQWLPENGSLNQRLGGKT